MEKKLTERISFIPAVEEPLSSDVLIVRGDSATYIFDVGHNTDVSNYLNGLPGKKTVIISHFHEDHTGGLNDINFDRLLVGNYTAKSLKMGEAVEKRLTIEDGVKLDIIPCPSSHAKGSLVLMIDDEYLLTGDSTYCTGKNDEYFYNVSLLSEQIKLFESLPATKYYLSHRAGRFLKKELIVRQLHNIFIKRVPGNPLIPLTED